MHNLMAFQILPKNQHEFSSQILDLIAKDIVGLYGVNDGIQ